jgi:hypothetical protein
MKTLILIFVTILCLSFNSSAQINKDELALEVSKIDAENTQKLKEYTWRLYSKVFGEGGTQTNMLSDFRYSDKGNLEIQIVEAETNNEKKPGVRGAKQQSMINSKIELIFDAFKHLSSYTYMTKGQLLDLFDKSIVTEKDGIITVIGKDIYTKGDQMTLLIDSKSKNFLKRTITTKMKEIIINGEIEYDTFEKTGVNHVTTTKMDIPSEKIKVEGENKDYTKKVE